MATLRGIKATGFDGVEYHLIGGGGHRTVLATRTRAHELGLDFHVHQGWSLAENSTHWHNHVLDLFGLLPRAGYTLAEHVPLALREENVPTVVYADRMPEIERAEGLGRFWVQTCSTFNGHGKHALPYPDFIRMVRRQKFGLVFDTQHYIEYACGSPGVGRLSTNSRELFRTLKSGWAELKDLVMEIHLANFDPVRGNTRGRNVPLETGVLPLREFCRTVRESGWEGTVVPEVRSMFWRTTSLRALREQVVNLFEKG